MDRGSFDIFQARFASMAFAHLVAEVAAWEGEVALNAILAALSRFVEMAADDIELTASERERAIGLAVVLERFARRVLHSPEHREKLRTMEAAIAMSLHHAGTYGLFPEIAEAIRAQRRAKGLPPLDEGGCGSFVLA